MATTIQVSEELANALKGKKLHEKESYEEVIWDLIEDTKELADETKRAVARAREDIKSGRVHTHEQVRKMLGL